MDGPGVPRRHGHAHPGTIFARRDAVFPRRAVAPPRDLSSSHPRLAAPFSSGQPAAPPSTTSPFGPVLPPRRAPAGQRPCLTRPKPLCYGPCSPVRAMRSGVQDLAGRHTGIADDLGIQRMDRMHSWGSEIGCLAATEPGRFVRAFAMHEVLSGAESDVVIATAGRRSFGMWGTRYRAWLAQDRIGDGSPVLPPLHPFGNCLQRLHRTPADDGVRDGEGYGSRTHRG